MLKAELEMSDPAGKPLQVRWVVQPEQTHKLTAGAEENMLPELTNNVTASDLHHAEVRVPAKPGGYRLFAYVRNGVGAAVANVPFYVSSLGKNVAGKGAKLPFMICFAEGNANDHFVPLGWMRNTNAPGMDPLRKVLTHSGNVCLHFE